MPATLLALETATAVCSVALVQADRVTAALTLDRPRAHAANLTPMVRDALTYGGIAAADLDAVAVSAGPGSYTGLRIGVSTAKGLALAADAALVAVPSLDALAASAAPYTVPGDGVCALFNARRDEVYAAVFRVGEQHRLDALIPPAAIPVAALPDRLQPYSTQPLWLVGEGAERAAPVLNASPSFTLRTLDPTVAKPSAAAVARLGLRRLAEGRTEDLAAFEPFYLKAFVAKKPQGSIFEKLPF